MYLPSSETERYGITNGSCPLVVFSPRNHVEDLSTDIHLFLVPIIIIIIIIINYNAPVPVLQKRAPSTVQLHISGSIHS